MLNSDEQKAIYHNVVKQLKEIDVDGETAEQLLEDIGMSEQVLRQLMLKAPWGVLSQHFNEKTDLAVNQAITSEKK